MVCLHLYFNTYIHMYVSTYRRRLYVYNALSVWICVIFFLRYIYNTKKNEKEKLNDVGGLAYFIWYFTCVLFIRCMYYIQTYICMNDPLYICLDFVSAAVSSVFNSHVCFLFVFWCIMNKFVVAAVVEIAAK